MKTQEHATTNPQSRPAKFKRAWLITVYRDEDTVPFNHIESSTLVATGRSAERAAEKIAKALGWAEGFWSFSIDKWLYIV